MTETDLLGQTEELRRAYAINAAMFRYALIREGVFEPPAPDLSEYTLSEMIAAGPAITAAENRKEGGTLTVVCADRLVAALYALTHYPAPRGDDAEVLAWDGTKALCILRHNGDGNDD